MLLLRCEWSDEIVELQRTVFVCAAGSCGPVMRVIGFVVKLYPMYYGSCPSAKWVICYLTARNKLRRI